MVVFFGDRFRLRDIDFLTLWPMYWALPTIVVPMSAAKIAPSRMQSWRSCECGGLAPLGEPTSLPADVQVPAASMSPSRKRLLLQCRIGAGNMDGN